MSVQAVLLHTFLINLSMCVLLHRYPVQSFIPRTSQRKRVLKKSRGIFSSKTSSASLEETSSQLLSLVLDRWNRGTRETNEEESIDRLMQSLSDARASFDPDECLTGTFYATLYTSGPTPLWERLSLSAFGTRNIQGQQLTKVGDGEGRVLNYSEAWGRGLHLRAEGTFRESAGGRCPVDFSVAVTSAAVCVGGRCVGLPVSGEAILRVLYADRNLRLFESVVDSTWEEQGLVAIQVRVDLVDSKWTNLVA